MKAETMLAELNRLRKDLDEDPTDLEWLVLPLAMLYTLLGPCIPFPSAPSSATALERTATGVPSRECRCRNSRIVSTSSGVLSDRQCREKNVGGEVVAIVT